MSKENKNLNTPLSHTPSDTPNTNNIQSITPLPKKEISESDDNEGKKQQYEGSHSDSSKVEESESSVLPQKDHDVIVPQKEQNNPMYSYASNITDGPIMMNNIQNLSNYQHQNQLNDVPKSLIDDAEKLDENDTTALENEIIHNEKQYQILTNDTSILEAEIIRNEQLWRKYIVNCNKNSENN
eukprot:349960_1